MREIGLGCMRLSHPGDDSAAHLLVVAAATSQATVHAALDAGIRLFDTADVYAPTSTGTGTADDIGHNERLLAAGLTSWASWASGPRDSVTVATKGGLVRPAQGGRWQPDGRARHLAAACEASLGRLGRIDLYQLHVVDPRTPLATSVRALASLRRAGLVGAIGLCNVTATQLGEALDLTDIASVQVAIGPFDDRAVRGGVVALALSRGVRVLAHTPLGGPRGVARLARDREPALAEVAERHGATPAEVFLAWLVAHDLEPLAGATRPETARSAARALELARRLDDADRAALGERFGWLTPRSRATAASSESDRQVVLIMGIQGAGKSTLAAEKVGEGWLRLNRDETGGSLDGLAAVLDDRLAAGARRVVLDNTYATRRSRAAVLDAAARHGAQVACVWLDAAIEVAQVNVCARLVEGTEGLSGAPGPDALFRFRRELEPPGADEGFSSIDVRHVARIAPRRPGTRRGVLVDCDAALWRSRSGGRSPADADDVQLRPGARELAEAFWAEGLVVAGLSWQPEIAAGARTAASFGAAVARLEEALGAPLDVRACPHPAGPPICWCRLPLPGLGVVLARAHDLDLAASSFIGRGPAGKAFAAKLGLAFREAAV